MATFTIKEYLQILQDMQTWIIANQDIITDFNEGGVLSSELEAFARQMEQLYIRSKVGFENYLVEIPYSVFDFARKPGLKAAGQVVFSRSEPDTDVVDIPAGTKVGTEAGIYYLTTEAAEIASMETDSAATDVQAVELGKAGNVPAATITVMITPIHGVDSVNNPAPITGGQDAETDTEYKKRFQEYILGLGKGSNYGLIAGAKTVNSVRSASIVDHFPPYSDLYHCTLYIDDGAGNASEELIDEVRDVIEGDGTESNPGYRVPGINVRILAPTKVTVDVTAEIVASGTLGNATVEALLQSAITDYINNLTIGEDVIKNKIVERIMSTNGVADQTLTAPASNVVIGGEQIARIGTISITFV